MTGDRLLRLYPRAWRERYGDEFLALVGDEPLSARHTIDILAGAIDARLSRTASTPDQSSASPAGGNASMSALKAKLCEKEAAFTIRDSLLGAAIVIGVSIAAVLLSKALEGVGYDAAGEAITLFGASGGLLISMPFWLTKGQSTRVQAVIVGVPLVMLASLSIFVALK